MVDNDNGTTSGNGCLIAIGLLVALLLSSTLFAGGPLDLIFDFLMMISIWMFGVFGVLIGA